MYGILTSIALIVLLGGAASAQPTPSPPPQSTQQKPTAKPPEKPVQKPADKLAAKPGIQPAPRTSVHRTPLVSPKPGAPARPARPVAKPPVPAVVPPPAAVPTPEAEKPVEPGKGSNTGQPIPRFATLRSDDVNLRSGPGTRYPIEWVYKRRDLPVQIEREFEVWRLVRDHEGVKGWVHQAVLAPRRTGVVIGDEQVLRRDPKDDAAPVARLKPGVIVRLRSCEQAADWCQGQVQDYRGWIKRTAIWGTFPGEAIQ